MILNYRFILILILFGLFFTSAHATGKTDLQIRVFSESLETPAAKNLTVKINGVKVGVTDVDGQINLKVEPNKELTVRVLELFSEAGDATITPVSGIKNTVDVILTGEGLAVKSTLASDQIKNGILPDNFKNLAFHFNSPGNECTSLESWQLYRESGKLVEITPYFKTASNGNIVANDIESLNRILNQSTPGKYPQPIEISGYADTNGGEVCQGNIEFRLGKFTVNGRLTAPPSNPTLKIAGVKLRANLMGTDTYYNITSDKNGRFEIPHVPAGALAFEGGTKAGDLYYNATGTAEVDFNKDITLVLVTTADVINNVASIKVSDGKPSPGMAHIMRTPRRITVNSEKN